jgi:type VI secretion system protein ImpC
MVIASDSGSDEEPSMPGRLGFDLGFVFRSGRRRDDGDPMRLLILGDFSGKAAAERTPIGARPMQRLDIDTFDDVMRRMAPRLGGPAGEIRFEQIDDFHPDRLYARLDVFQALRDARAKRPAGNDGLLGRLLGKPAEPDVRPPAAPSGGLNALIRDVVAPHIVKDTSAQTATYLAAVDAAIAVQMGRCSTHWRSSRWRRCGAECGGSSPPSSSTSTCNCISSM